MYVLFLIIYTIIHLFIYLKQILFQCSLLLMFRLNKNANYDFFYVYNMMSQIENNLIENNH